MRPKSCCKYVHMKSKWTTPGVANNTTIFTSRPKTSLNTRAAWYRSGLGESLGALHSIQSFNSYRQSIYWVAKSLAKVLCAQGVKFREAQFKTKQFREAQTSLQSFSLSTSLQPMSCQGIEPGFLWPINLQIHLAYRSPEVLGSILVWGGKSLGRYIQSNVTILTSNRSTLNYSNPNVRPHRLHWI